MGLDQSVYAVKFFKEIPDFVSSEYSDSFLPAEFDYWGEILEFAKVDGKFVSRKRRH